MKNHPLFGKKVVVIGERKTYRFQKGKIVAEGNNDYIIVKLECGRRAWIKKWNIFFLN
ncbi:hypothetical protein [Rossellomorea marisflavi]|uniref:hypothetical protein n=1 Tax=Rossellomorea marisflavi TaxID=189381 RepID=UPI0035144636